MAKARPARIGSGPAAAGDRPDRDFFARDPVELAPDLLGKLLVHGDTAGRIVEVEAYRGDDDPASHASRGPRYRNRAMFGPPGHLYVYFTYGMHWCANVVGTEAGEPGAVLVRGLAPLTGLEAMRDRRPAASRDIDLASGPAKLCQALAITGDHDGADLMRGPVQVLDDGTPPPATPATGPRVGISAATERPWRFAVPGDHNVSRPRPAAGPRW